MSAHRFPFSSDRVKVFTCIRNATKERVSLSLFLPLSFYVSFLEAFVWVCAACLFVHETQEGISAHLEEKELETKEKEESKSCTVIFRGTFRTIGPCSTSILLNVKDCASYVETLKTFSPSRFDVYEQPPMSWLHEWGEIERVSGKRGLLPSFALSSVF